MFTEVMTIWTSFLVSLLYLHLVWVVLSKAFVRVKRSEVFLFKAMGTAERDLIN